mgnify:CR=1 FL=1
MLPIRFRFGDVGLHWPSDSQEMMWDHQTGKKLNQAEAWVEVLFLRFVIEPLCLAAAFEIPSCLSIRKAILTVPAVTTSKFTFVYVFRAISTGQPYSVHRNYLWDLTHNQLLKPLRAGILKAPAANARWLEQNSEFGPLLNLRVLNYEVINGDLSYVGVKHLNSTSTAKLLDGAVDPRPKIPDQPISDNQASLLLAFEAAHELHANALLARDSNISYYASKVIEAKNAFEASATSARQQMLFSLQFTGYINSGHSLSKIIQLTEATEKGFHTWVDAFNPRNSRMKLRQKPDFLRVIAGNFMHARAHYLRAAPPGVMLRTICDNALIGQGIMKCPINDLG